MATQETKHLCMTTGSVDEWKRLVQLKTDGIIKPKFVDHLMAIVERDFLDYDVVGIWDATNKHGWVKY